MLRPVLALAGAAMLAIAAPANAVLVLNSSGLIAGTDCSGDLGIPPECYAYDSPLIYKFDFDTGEEESGLFPSISGDEFSFTGGGDTTGTFTYTPDDAEDPGIRYWSLKSANAYEIFWFTMGAPSGPGDAVTVPTGVAIGWTTSNQRGLSHISFYDTDDQQLPEPASLALLGLGLLGLGFARRRGN